MLIPVLKGVQKGPITLLKNGHILLKVVLLKHNFQDEGLLYDNWWFYILIIYSSHFAFHFLSHSLCMYIPILTGAQKGCIASEKMVIFC